MIKKARTLLKNIFGYDDFRPLQGEAIAHLLQGHDTLVIMPTGGGKSLCYQLPALVTGGLTVVVSPLISLMHDQVQQLDANGVPAVCLNSTLEKAVYAQNTEAIQQGMVKLLYVAPETLLMERTLTLLKSVKVDCLAIDEAHCISEWGHDFRPEYRQIARVRQHFPEATCMALTATATPRVQGDIQSNLGFTTDDAFIASFDRENLFLEIIPKNKPYAQITRFLKQYPDQSGIIYCFSRKLVDDLALDLAADGFSVRPYHAGLSDAVRQRNQDAFIRDDVRIIIATIAFGMGINKSNVRFVIHRDLPKNIESYYQQIGRAGRDGLRAHCLLLFSDGDRQKISYFIQQMNPEEQNVARVHLDQLTALAETHFCRRRPLLRYFGEAEPEAPCDMCDNCTQPQQNLEDITRPMQMFLSCVKRTGERFGAQHMVDVLRGSEAIKVRKFGHEKLSVHGVGAEYSKAQWLHLSRQFMAMGLIEKDGTHGSLKVTKRGMAVLSDRETVMGTLKEETASPRRKQIITTGGDAALLALLKEWRKSTADEAGVPPYVIFSDRTLVQLAAAQPMDPASLLQIHGIGQAKLEHYGQALLEIISTYNGTALIDKADFAPPQPRPSQRQRRHVQVTEAFNDGASIDELMEQYQVKQATIIGHLFKSHRAGCPLRHDGLKEAITLAESDQEEITVLFDQHGTAGLRQIQQMRSDMAYDDLQLLRLVYLTQPTKK